MPILDFNAIASKAFASPVDQSYNRRVWVTAPASRMPHVKPPRSGLRLIVIKSECQVQQFILVSPSVEGGAPSGAKIPVTVALHM